MTVLSPNLLELDDAPIPRFLPQNAVPASPCKMLLSIRVEVAAFECRQAFRIQHMALC